MSLNLPARPVLLWTVRILSFAAMVVCFVITVMKLNGTISSLRGCGAEGGCAQVLGGRWSEWFHIPVTTGAGLVYLAILLLTLAPVRESLGRKGDQLLAAAGVVLAGAAVYFLYLMFFAKEDGGVCPWCLGLHAAGLTVAAILLSAAVQRQREGERGVMETAMLTGFMVVGILAAGQLWGPKPDTFEITSGGLKADTPGSTNPGITNPPAIVSAPAAGQPAARPVAFFGGELQFDAGALPLIGRPDARFVLVEFFDYTCRSCRDMAKDLRMLKEKWPAAFAVIVLPTPLNHSCNPFLRPTVQNHEGACELAKLSLALWRAKPAAFAEFHDYLFSLPLPAGTAVIEAARKKADDLAGAAAITAALEDPFVLSRLQQNFGVFAKLTTQNITMPKLILHSDVVMHGPARDAQAFVSVMEQQFGLKGAGSPPAQGPK